mgnify:CR=1 FL=1
MNKVISREYVEKNYIEKQKVKEFINNNMKKLWVDTCAEDSGKYTAYMKVLNFLEGTEDANKQ